MKKTKAEVIEILKRAAPPHSPFGEHIDDWEKRYEILLDECADAIMETECQHEWKVKKDSGYCSKCGITTEPEGEGAIDDAIKSIESKRKSTKYKMVPQPPPSEAAIEPTKSAEELIKAATAFIDKTIKIKGGSGTPSAMKLYENEKRWWTNKLIEFAEQYAQSQLPSSKSAEEIKKEWQIHNRDNGMSWNEVAELVNRVAQSTIPTEGENIGVTKDGVPIYPDSFPQQPPPEAVVNEQLYSDEYEQALIRDGESYAAAYVEGLRDGHKQLPPTAQERYDEEDVSRKSEASANRMGYKDRDKIVFREGYRQANLSGLNQ